MPRIAFNRPYVAEHSFDYLRQAIANSHLSGDGPFTKRCQALLSQWHGGARVMLTTSCTHALELAGLLLDLEPGDEVIVPSFTFVSTVNAFVLRGAIPVFADIRPDTLNIDESLLPRLLSPRTRAIVPVHYAGVGCEMNAICRLAEEAGVAVVEDNAHGLFGAYHGRSLGTIAPLAALSFHETKNVSCGEGGALILNDPALVERAEILREKGTNRSRFFRGEVDKYTWVDVGSSYVISDGLAALLLANLEVAETTQARRRVLWNRYIAELADWADDNNIRVPHVPGYCQQPCHLFYLLLPSLADRQEFITHLKDNGVDAVFHYVPLHNSPAGRRLGGAAGDCPVTEDISDRLVRLPLHARLQDDEQARAIRAIRKFNLRGRALVAAA